MKGFRGSSGIRVHGRGAGASIGGTMEDQQLDARTEVPGSWTAVQATRAMAAGEPGGSPSGEFRESTPQPTDAASGLHRRAITAAPVAVVVALGTAIAVLWSIPRYSTHERADRASIGSAVDVPLRIAMTSIEEQPMIPEVKSASRASSADITSANRAASAALALAGMVGGTAFADSSSHRYADFSNARATVAVAGSANWDAQYGFTAECRIWIDAMPVTTDDAYPASIMFEHASGIDHKWLAIHSGKATGLAVNASSGDDWWNRLWIDSAQTLPTRRWVHVAYVIGTDGKDRMYVDGQLSKAATQSVSSRQNGATMHLGSALMADMSRILDSFGGKLDWIRISSTARYVGESFDVPSEDSLVPDDKDSLLVTFNGSTVADAFVDLSLHHHAMTPGSGVDGGTVPPIIPDCNGNGTDDRSEIAQGLLPDSNSDGIPDTCQCGAI
ncbi:MAG: LamG domain-containing protein, partial [Planctomycetes bacterium]|nr:LamG domain-containing protein [Planctomycetota bacterium]